MRIQGGPRALLTRGPLPGYGVAASVTIRFQGVDWRNVFMNGSQPTYNADFACFIVNFNVS